MRDHELLLWLAELIKAGPEAAEAQGVNRLTYERGRTASAWPRRRLAAVPLDHSGGEPFTLTAGLPTLGGLGRSQALRALAACEGTLYTDAYGTGTTDT